MECNDCGKSLKDNSGVCECGAINIVTGAPKKPKPPAVHPYQKLGGLLVFIAIITLLMIIAVLIYAVRAPFVNSGLPLAHQLITLVFTSTWMYANIQLLRRRSNFFIISIFALYGGSLWSLVRFTFTPFSAGLDTCSIFLVFGLDTLILLYYIRSVRVRTYMGTDKYITDYKFLKFFTPPQPAVLDAVKND